MRFTCLLRPPGGPGGLVVAGGRADHGRAMLGYQQRLNEELAGKPALANEDPYGAGWLVVLKPSDWAAAKAKLTPGAEVAAKYEAKMAADGFAGCGA